VKKILSISLALGLVLGMILGAMPVTAQPPPGDWTVVGVTVAPNCELQRGAYNITFGAPATLTQGFHTISVKFPEGTAYPPLWRTGHILVNGTAVFGTEITQEGDVVTFLVPETTVVGPILVQFVPVTAAGVTTGVVNPPAGLYNLELKTSRAPMSTWVKSGWTWGPPARYAPYIIRPTVSTYAWSLDFGPTYDGIKPGFVPPFKACGQEGFGFEDNGRWVTEFDLSLGASPWWFYGCQGCPNMEAYITMTARPSTAARAHLYLDETLVHNFTSTNPLSPAQYYLLDDWDILAPDPDDEWALGLHFDTVGTYTLCFELIYSGTGVCELGCASVTLCIDFDVKQVKDAFAIPLYEKWNLISLPLVPFDSDIDAMVASLDDPWGDLLSIWHYDAFDKEWLVYGNGQTSLTDIEDGKSYWFRLWYSHANPDPDPVLTWWVFGTEKPQPPAGPLQYPVAQGWNMVGFTSMTDYPADEYLWNWGAPNPVIYGWNQDQWNLQTWELIGFTDNLESGQGYWMAFPVAGEIYVP